MKALLLSTMLCCPLATVFGQDAPEKKPTEHLVAVGVSVVGIQGTRLQGKVTSASHAKGSWFTHDCTIGFSQHGDDGKDWTFVPVLELPRLKNDRYRAECKNGVLTLTTAEGKSAVVILNLKAIAPSLLTTKTVGHAGSSDGGKFRITWDIPGTLLRIDAFAPNAEEGGSAHDCIIGYSQDGDDGEEWTFVPVLELPRLNNDRYRVECKNGVLTVTTAQGKLAAVTLNLKAIAPYLLTTRPVEQAAASDGEKPSK